jgi:anti-anti-sigma regulatory factor
MTSFSAALEPCPVRFAGYSIGRGAATLHFMGTAGHHAPSEGWNWEQDSEGVSRFVPAGDLDYDVHADLAAALATVPHGSGPIIDIDLRCVTFLDAGTARLLGRFRATAHLLGKEVRIVNATGMPRKVLIVLGVLPPEGVAGTRRPGPCPQPLANLSVLSSDVVAMARSTIARARELRSEVERLREARRRRESE